jgi:TolB protein
MKNILHSSRIICIVLCLIFSGCNENTIDPVFYGSLEGTVTYELSGLPAKGVEISTIPSTTIILTDSVGHFSLSNIPTGEYSVTAKLEGYKNATNKVVVNKNSTTTTDILITPAAAAAKVASSPTPANRSQNVNRSVTLKWTTERGEEEEVFYDVVLYESNADTALIRLVDYKDTVINVTNLKFNTTYYWQVNSKNTFGLTTNGELWQFKTLPFPDNRFLFTTQRDGNYEIYSSDETANQLIRLTHSDKDELYPQYSNNRNLIAFTTNTDLNHHIYIMDKNGSNPLQITTLPVEGFHNNGRGFCWSPDNGKILYSHYDKLYTVDRNGSNLTLISTAPAGRNYRACDWTDAGNKIVVETVGTLPFDSEIHLIDLTNSTDVVILQNTTGTLQSPSFSIDGKSVLYTYDVSQFESAAGRQLNSRLFLYNIATGISTDLSKDKVNGTNDLNPRFSPDGSKVIFENRSNDGTGASTIWTFEIVKETRTKLFDNAAMPDWQ